MFLKIKMLKNKYILIAMAIIFFSFFSLSNVNTREVPGSAYDFTFVDIDGKNFPLSQFKGKPLLIFNSASKCGFTSQYTGIQKIHENYFSGARGIVMAAKLKIKKGDRVIVISGRDKGKTGDVLKVTPVKHRAIVQGVNMIKLHQRPSQTVQGGIVEKEAAIDISNLAHIDPKDQQATRVGFKVLEGGRKVRFAKRSGEVIDT